jgi:protein-L-isoaspartate(D-aspartate) O-methyltransferase
VKAVIFRVLEGDVLSNSLLIQYMLQTGYLKSERIADAFKAIDRKDFVIARDKLSAYEDRPLQIGYGQTISQPSTVAFMMESLDAKPGDKVMDVGSGSGWTTALMAYIVGRYGSVLGLEIIPQLVKFGRGNLSKYDLNNAQINRASKTVGAPNSGPYDRILVSAATDSVPMALLDQLKSGGRLVIPVMGAIEVIEKRDDGSLSQEAHQGFMFVPLV